MGKKITLATVKTFVRKNADRMHIMYISNFDGMTDRMEYSKDRKFVPAQPSNLSYSDTLGIMGAWIVGGSRNRFSEYCEDGFRGISVSNCCARFVLGVAE